MLPVETRVETRVDSDWLQRLKLESDKLPSSCGFFNSQPYVEAIAGETQPRYRVTSTDVGCSLRIVVAKAGGVLRTSTRPTLNRRTESALLYEHSP